jgi:hypothetical protein
LKNDQTDAFEWFVYATYIVWVATILTEILTYLVGRGGGGKRPHDGQCSAFPLTLFNRVSLPGGADDLRCAHGMILLVWFLALGASASTMLYTVLSHMFVKRNSYFMWLFVAFVRCHQHWWHRWPRRSEQTSELARVVSGGNHASNHGDCLDLLLRSLQSALAIRLKTVCERKMRV